MLPPPFVIVPFYLYLCVSPIQAMPGHRDALRIAVQNQVAPGKGGSHGYNHTRGSPHPVRSDDPGL